MRDHRLLKQVRRPGSDHREDIGWERAIDEIAGRIKKTRDDTLVDKYDRRRTVNFRMTGR